VSVVIGSIVTFKMINNGKVFHQCDGKIVAVHPDYVIDLIIKSNGETATLTGVPRETQGQMFGNCWAAKRS
jgi:hypothetical protein